MDIVIDGVKYEGIKENTVLEALRSLNIHVPTLCYHKDLNPQGYCNICVVEVDGDLVKSCETHLTDNMNIVTNSENIISHRKEVLEKILENHPNDCLTCEKGRGDCELQNLAYEFGVENRNKENKYTKEIDTSTHALSRDMNKCILCGRCVEMCNNIQKISVYEMITKEDGTRDIVIRGGKNLMESKCIGCGQCVKVCPVGALHEKNSLVELCEVLNRKNKHIIVQMAPAVKHTLGEEFGIDPGIDITGKMVTALRKVGFNKVFSTDFTADVTIMEEGTEFLDRIVNDKTLPMFTSCCPGWVNYIEKHYPQLLDNVSSCKSPQQMFGALAKTYYPKISKLNPKDIYSVSIMPCTAKKDEIEREQMITDELKDVDIVITTRELAKLLRLRNIDLESQEPSDFDELLGFGTGAARIFASSGGVMEAALRTVSHVLSDGKIEIVDYKTVRGLDGVKEATVEIDSQVINIAVVNGIGNVKPVLDGIIEGKLNYQFVEVMACKDGCIGGGGAPIPDDIETRKKRMQGIYKFDSEQDIRKSFQNSEVKKLYDEFLQKPNSHLSHHILHTEYVDRSK
ncbi:NADH-dependent [FeFe] hydrogenase, group A6 [Brassicibacter mesophilus]|uniref:NADH-dependent [FeFe] hydrogenase, group A6 n=1 Tax=Brassicibacter mesophilus TaxID=745119 RepID=UPI003D1D7BC9